jgi:hypothetical protein
MKKFIVLLAALTLVVLVVPMMAQESILPPSANKALIEDQSFNRLIHKQCRPSAQ